MHNNSPSGLMNLWQRSCKRILSGSWIIGLLLGMWLAAGAGDSFSLMMRGTGFQSVSIPGLLLITSLPFLLTALAVFLSRPFLLLIPVLFKAVSFGFCAFGIMSAYSGAGWLVGSLLMFTDIGSLPFLMWLWLRSCDMPEKHRVRDFVISLTAVFALVILDITVVSPFAAMLL